MVTKNMSSAGLLGHLAGGLAVVTTFRHTHLCSEIWKVLEPQRSAAGRWDSGWVSGSGPQHGCPGSGLEALSLGAAQLTVWKELPTPAVETQARV